MLNRRSFVKNSAAFTLLGLNNFDAIANYAAKNNLISLSIFHTNDVHSRIEPFPKSSKKFAGFGGFAKRYTILNKLRKNLERSLLLDAGDIIQGTPYFNLFKGELEIKLMNKLKYDAATIGNHDFDGGINGLNKMVEQSNFSFINSNYDFTNTILKDKINKYKIFDFKPIKVGIFGLGIELNGLVPAELYQHTIYNNPMEVAEQMSHMLKHKLNCDYVICLSHLGYQYKSNRLSDEHIALNINDLDLIIGGHTHTFMSEPQIVTNKNNKKVMINQVGWAGINVGYLNILFDKKSKKIKEKRHTVIKVK